MADDIITLYHGSGSLFSTFDLRLCKPRIDFGRGLYLTSNKDQAIGMAYRKRAAGGPGYLYTYQMSTADTKQLTKLSFKTLLLIGLTLLSLIGQLLLSICSGMTL